MLPTLFEFGGFAVPAYAIFTIVAYSLGFWWLHRGARRVMTDVDSLPGLYIAVMVGGMLGARLMHIVGGEGIWAPVEVWTALVSSMVGLAFLGGVLGGTVGAVAYMIGARMPVFKLLDVAAPGLMLGLAAGRTGCLLAGCCHGRVVPVESWDPLVSLSGGSIVTVELPPYLAVVFHSGAHGSVLEAPVYPTQLAEVTAAVALAGLLAWMWEQFRRFDGQIFASMLLGYGGVRWGIEALRGDEVRGAAHDVAGLLLSTGRVSSLFVGLAAVLLVIARHRTGVAPEPVEGPELGEDAPEVDLSGLEDEP